MADVRIFITAEDMKQARLYWGAMPLPTGSELIGLLARPSGELGAAIKMPSGIINQGNAGVMKATNCKV